MSKKDLKESTIKVAQVIYKQGNNWSVTEVARMLERGYSQIRGHFEILEKADFIQWTGERRAGARTYQATMRMRDIFA